MFARAPSGITFRRLRLDRASKSACNAWAADFRRA
jgi:hypothetical protein